MTRVGIVWFRNDLRLHDNLVLNEAIDMLNKKKLDKLIPFYCFDSEILDGKSRLTQIPRCGPMRRNFLIESIENLKENLINKLKSNLYIAYGSPVDELVKLVDELNVNDTKTQLVKCVLAQKEVVHEEIEMEKRLKGLLKDRRSELHLIWDMTLVHMNDLPFKNIDDFPDMFTSYRKKVEIRGEATYTVRKPVEYPLNYILPTYELSKWNHEHMPVKAEYTQPQKSAIVDMKGGETQALNRVIHYFFKTDGLKDYKATRNGLVGQDYSSKLSMWLSHGCISARQLYAKVKQYEENKGGANEGTAHFCFELLWRDFFKFHSYKYGRKIFYLSGLNINNSSKAAKNYPWKSDMSLFRKWCDGETGYPFVDANMRELKETGWMSNRGRQNVASFLTKDLDIDWRFGAEWFESMLIDYDCTSNWGNWQYAAGVGTDPRLDRYFNVIKQAYDYDETGEFVRLWLPMLDQLPVDYVHCPFRMSYGDQMRFKCVLGKDYPQPLVRMKFQWNPEARKRNKFADKSKKRK